MISSPKKIDNPGIIGNAKIFHDSPEGDRGQRESWIYQDIQHYAIIRK